MKNTPFFYLNLNWVEEDSHLLSSSSLFCQVERLSDDVETEGKAEPETELDNKNREVNIVIIYNIVCFLRLNQVAPPIFIF